MFVVSTKIFVDWNGPPSLRFGGTAGDGCLYAILLEIERVVGFYYCTGIAVCYLNFHFEVRPNQIEKERF
jgi:hypothetical protein